MSRCDAGKQFVKALALCYGVYFPLGTTTAGRVALGIFLLLTFPISTLGFPGMPVARSRLLVIVVVKNSGGLSIVFAVTLSGTITVS